MMRKERCALYLFILASVFFIGSVAPVSAQQGSCVFPTGTGEVGYAPGWGSSLLVIFIDEEDLNQDGTLARGACVDMWVETQGWGKPPYDWTLSGTGFHFDNIDGPTEWTSNTEFQIVRLCADNNACGPVTIMATDSYKASDEAVIRSASGVWKYKGYQNANWTTSPTCKNCWDNYGITETYIVGDKKWQVKFNAYGRHCSRSNNCVEWGTTQGFPPPPCGDPHECAAGDWTCTCGETVPYYQQYRYWKYQCE